MSNLNNPHAPSHSLKKRCVQRPRIHTEVLSCLLEDLQSGVYAVGQKLPSERDLMDEFGVGRPAVREALSALARMGLIEVSAGMRARVCRLTLKPLLREMQTTLDIYSKAPDGWRQLHDLRLFFETSLVRLVAGAVTQTQLAHLQEILQEQKTFLDAGAIRDFAAADIKFHQALVQCLDNRFLELLAEGFAGWLIEPLYASLQVQRQSELSYNAHLAVFHALQEHNADLAEKTMREHLSGMRDLYQQDRMAHAEGASK